MQKKVRIKPIAALSQKVIIAKKMIHLKKTQNKKLEKKIGLSRPSTMCKTENIKYHKPTRIRIHSERKKNL